MVFDTDEEVKKLADELELPILSTSYDTFTVATMINRAIYDQLIKKEIILVEDILTPIDQTAYLLNNDNLGSWYKKNKLTSHSRFPVVDKGMKVLGMVTSKDIIEHDYQVTIEKVMTKILLP